MIYPAHYLISAVLCAVAIAWLSAGGRGSRWPRGSLIAWQAIALGFVLSLVGALLSLGLAPYRRGVIGSGLAYLHGALGLGHGADRIAWWQHALAVTGIGTAAWLLGAAVWSVRAVWQSRRRHRLLLDLVGRADREHSAIVIDHPAPIAYCLPGRNRGVVLSSGALELLTAAQLAAVLAHEHVHLRERHHLVLVAFDMLDRALPRSRWVDRATSAVRVLIEMCADDRATRQHDRAVLADALQRFRDTPQSAVPAPALAAADPSSLDARIQRLRSPSPRPARAWRLLLIVASVTLAATPASLYLFPL